MVITIANAAFLSRALLGSLIVIIIGFIPLIILFATGQSKLVAYFMALPLLLFVIPLLIIISLIQGVIFTAVNDINDEKKFQFKPALSQAMILLKPIFFYNLIL